MRERHGSFDWGPMLGTIRMAEANLTALVGAVLLNCEDDKLIAAAENALDFVERLPEMTRQLCEVRREIAHDAALAEDDERQGGGDDG